MATAIQVCRQKLGQAAVGFRQIIVPVRFARAVTGPTVWDAPDPDDRGFALGSDGIWRVAGVRGAVTGIPVGKTVRLKVVREDIDATAPIFVTSDQERLVVTPTAALGADGVFRARVTGPILVGAKIQARLGAANGPILGEVLVNVMDLAGVPICAHLVTLNGTAVNGPDGTPVPAATSRDEANVRALITEVNGIYQPTGVYFNIASCRAYTYSLTTSLGAIAGGCQGCLAILENGDWNIQGRELVSKDRAGRQVNVYFVRHIYKGVINSVPGRSRTSRSASGRWRAGRGRGRWFRRRSAAKRRLRS
jgi:hypothetical protein